MAQVYQFVDANGETRLFAEITPDPAGTPFNGGTITEPLTIDTAGTPDVTGLVITSDDTGSGGGLQVDYPHCLFGIGSGGTVLFQGNDSPVFTVQGTSGTDAQLKVRGATSDVFLDSATGGVNTNGAGGVALADGVKTTAITSGALPTVVFASGTARQVSTSRDVTLVVPFTGDGTNNAATLLIELSPNNVTFSTLDTLSIAAALNLTGALNTPVTLTVPAAWRVRLTATHGTIGTGTYY